MEEFRRQRIDPSRLPRQVTEKFSLDVLGEGFVPFPKTLLRTMHVIFVGPHAIADLAAVLAIADYRRPNLSRGPSLAYLAFLSGLDEPSFRAAMQRLRERGLIVLEGDEEELDIQIDGLLNAIRTSS